MNQENYIQVCEGFWSCLTPDGILNAIVTILTIGGAFFIAWFTTRRQQRIQNDSMKEASKKIYMSNKRSFNQVVSTTDLLIRGKNTTSKDIDLSIKELELHVNKINESGIISYAPTDIFPYLEDYKRNGIFILHAFKIVYEIVQKEGYKKYEEYLLDRQQVKHYDGVEQYMESIEEAYENMKLNLNKIKKYYK